MWFNEHLFIVRWFNEHSSYQENNETHRSKLVIRTSPKLFSSILHRSSHSQDYNLPTMVYWCSTKCPRPTTRKRDNVVLCPSWTRWARLTATSRHCQLQPAPLQQITSSAMKMKRTTMRIRNFDTVQVRILTHIHYPMPHQLTLNVVFGKLTGRTWLMNLGTKLTQN